MRQAAHMRLGRVSCGASAVLLAMLVASACAPRGTDCSSDVDCADSFACNGDEACVDGTCQSGTAVDCDDAVACTLDFCQEPNGACRNVADDTACSANEICDPTGGCTAPAECSGPADCDDGLFCSGQEGCLDGACVVTTPLDCDDGVACTVDICDESADACVYLADDGACAGGKRCDILSGCIPVAECVDLLDCGDGLFCNGVELCVAGFCEAGTPPNCSDTIACTIGVCDEAADACVQVPNHAACAAGEQCDPATGCVVIPQCSAPAD